MLERTEGEQQALKETNKMARPTRVTLTIQDNDNQTAQSGFYLGSVIDTLASIESAAEAVTEAIQAVITGTVIACQITVPLDMSAWTLVPSTGDAQDRLVAGRLVMRNIDNNKAELNFPTFDIAKVTAGTKNVDQADVDIAALLAALQGTTLTTNQDNEVSTVVTFVETYGGKSR